MKFVKGQDVSYTTLSGRSYKATILERKMDFKKGLMIKCASKSIDFHYLIKVQKNGVSEEILCAENHLQLLEKKSKEIKKAA